MTADDSVMDYPSTNAYNVYAAAIFVLFLFGLFVHALLFYSLHRYRGNRERVLTPYIFSIAIANTTMIVISLPMTFANSLAHKWLFSDAFCRMEGFIGGLTTISTLYTLTCVVRKVHHVVSRVDVKTSKPASHKSALSSLVIVWLLTVLVMLPPLTGVTSMTQEAGQTNCAPNWRPRDSADMTYALMLVVISFILPISACLYYLSNIRRGLSRSARGTHDRPGHSRVQNAYKGVTKVVAVSVFAYVVTWLPYCVCVLVAVFGGAHLLETEGVTFIPTLIAKMSILGIPLIYFVLNAGFRRTVLQLLQVKSSRHPSLPPLRNGTTSQVRRNLARKRKVDVVKSDSDINELGFEQASRSNWTFEDELEFSAITNSTSSHRLELRRNAIHLHIYSS